MKILEISAYIFGICFGIWFWFSGMIVQNPASGWIDIINMLQSGKYVIVWPAVFGALVCLGLTVSIYIYFNRKKHDNVAKV